MRVILSLCLFFSVFGLPSSLWAQSENEIKSAIQTVLRVRHPHETGEWWKSLGPGAAVVIVSLYEEDKNIYHRIRLLDALSWFDDPAATMLLKKEAENNSNKVVQNAALQSLATSQSDREEEFLTQAMKSDDPQRRLAIGNGLSRSKSAQSQRMIRTLLKNERTEWVASKLEAHVKAGRSKGGPLIRKWPSATSGAR